MIINLSYYPALIEEVDFNKIVDKLSLNSTLNKNLEEYSKIRYEFFTFCKINIDNLFKGVNFSIKDIFDKFKYFDYLFKLQIELLENLASIHNTLQYSLKYCSIFTKTFEINSDKYTNLICDIIWTRYCYSFLIVSILRKEIDWQVENIDFSKKENLEYLEELKSYLKDPLLKIKKLFDSSEDLWNYLNLMNIQIIDLKKDLLQFLFGGLKISFYNFEIFSKICLNLNNNDDTLELSKIFKIISVNLKEINSLKNLISSQNELQNALKDNFNFEFINFCENLNKVFASIILYKITKIKKKNLNFNTKDKTVILGKIDQILISMMNNNNPFNNYLIKIINKFLNEKNKRSLSKNRKLLENYTKEIDTSIFYNKNFIELIEYFKK